MIQITRHMNGRTAVIGATVTKVPGDARHLPMDLDGVPVDVWYTAALTGDGPQARRPVE